MKKKISSIFALATLVFAMADQAVAQTAPVDRCRIRIQHSYNDLLTINDLSLVNTTERFRISQSLCQSIWGTDSAVRSALTNSCRQNGGAKANYRLFYQSGTATSVTVKNFTAFCQDLVPELYQCTVWDKVARQWVQTNNPGCDGGGGDGGGGGGGEGGGDSGGGDGNGGGDSGGGN
jgi:hypothetical protein